MLKGAQGFPQGRGQEDLAPLGLQRSCHPWNVNDKAFVAHTSLDSKGPQTVDKLDDASGANLPMSSLTSLVQPSPGTEYSCWCSSQWPEPWGAACTCTVKNGCGTSTVRVPQSFPKPPQNFPPDQATHQLYVRELNMFLINVARNPHAFEKRVERRREIRFAELSMETGVPKLQTDDRAMCAGSLLVRPSGKPARVATKNS